MDTETITKTVAITALLGGVAYLAFRNRNKIVKLFNPSKEYTFENFQAKNNDAMQGVCNAFLIYADSFRGVYEPLYKGASGRLSKERILNAFAEWNIRMNNIRKAPVCLKDWWSTIVNGEKDFTEDELRGQMKLVVNMLFLSGIKRDNRKTLTVTDRTVLYYESVDETSWSLGQELRIQSPCWYIPCTPVRILEKGYCETFKYE